MLSDPTFYWTALKEYAELERAAGGPDPQIEVVSRALNAIAERPDVRARGAGMFANAYTVAGAAAQWAAGGSNLTVDWLRQHGMGVSKQPIGVPMRRERRAVLSPEKFIRAHEAWGEWVVHELPGVRDASWPELYASIRGVYSFGRYSAMKVAEVLYRCGVVLSQQSDIRAKDAKYPRRTLAHLFPEHYELLYSKDESQETLALCERLGTEVQEFLGGSFYDVETLLCTFRQCLTGKYPGRSQDRELAMWKQMEGYWGGGTTTRQYQLLPFYKIRHEAFRAQYLGELGSPPWFAARDDELKWEARYPDGVAY